MKRTIPRKGEEATRALAARVLGSLSAALVIATVAGVVAAPLLVYASAWGFAKDADKFELTVTMLRICFPYIFFISLTSFAAGILNAWGSFKVPAFTPVLLNLSFIGFALFAAPHFERPIVALAWAVFAGGVLQLAFQVPFLLRIRMLPAPKWDPRDEGVVRILKLMAPAALGVSVAQVSLVINTHIASWLGDGPVSTVDVLNQCRRGGEVAPARGTAWAPDPSVPAKLRVRFFWPFSGDYWIIDLGPGYDYAVVGQPSRDYLWILSRTPELAPDVYARILERLQRSGYDPARLVRTPPA